MGLARWKAVLACIAGSISNAGRYITVSVSRHLSFLGAILSYFSPGVESDYGSKDDDQEAEEEDAGWKGT